ncbi:MAG: hypothetical protein HY646_14455 [Acidobacteria bacterium]|nr:hypothetical protein [Acidobacteriota bacterium]
MNELLSFLSWCLSVIFWLLTLFIGIVAALSSAVAGFVAIVWNAIGLWLFPYLALATALTYAISRFIIERRQADLSWCLMAGECSRNLSIIASLSAFIRRGADGLTNPTALLETLPHAFTGAVIGLVLGFAFQLLGDITAIETTGMPTTGGITDEET